MLKGHCFIAALILLLCGAFANAAFAEDPDVLDGTAAGKNTTPDEQLLDELDSPEDGEDRNNNSFFGQVYTHFHGSVKARYYYFLKDADNRDNNDIDDGRHYTDLLLRFSDFVEQRYWKVNVSGWAAAGNQKDTYKGVVHWMQDRERKSRYLEINELYLSIFTTNCDMVAGKKVFVNGISSLYSPADRYTPYDLNDPGDPKKLGIWQAGIDSYFSGLTFSGYVFPVYQASKSPSRKSRWAATWDDQGTVPYNQEMPPIPADSAYVEEYPEIDMANISYLARLKGTLAGWDFFAAYYYGNNTNPVLKQEVEGLDSRFIKEIVKVYNISSGFSTTFGRLELHGEGTYNYSYGSKDDNYIDYVGGFTYCIDEYAKKIFLQKIDLKVEYAREIIVKKMNADQYYASSRDLRLIKNNILVFTCIKINEDLHIKYFFQYGFNDEGVCNRGTIEYRVAAGLLWNITGEFFDGEKGSYYGTLAKSDRILTSVKYCF